MGGGAGDVRADVYRMHASSTGPTSSTAAPPRHSCRLPGITRWRSSTAPRWRRRWRATPALTRSCVRTRWPGWTTLSSTWPHRSGNRPAAQSARHRLSRSQPVSRSSSSSSNRVISRRGPAADRCAAPGSSGLKQHLHQMHTAHSFIILGRKLISSLRSASEVLMNWAVIERELHWVRPDTAEGQSCFTLPRSGSDPHRIGSDPTHEH